MVQEQSHIELTLLPKYQEIFQVRLRHNVNAKGAFDEVQQQYQD
jgi:hypothetical protein